MCGLRSFPLVIGLAAVAVAHGQPEWQVFAGPQFDEINYRYPDARLPWYQKFPANQLDEYARASGWGWHAGASYTLGPDKIEGRGSIIFSQQRTTASYSRYQSSHGLGGGGQRMTTGEFDDAFTMVEMPIEMIIGGTSMIRVDVGLSPWLLVDVDHRDHGSITDSWWIYMGGSGTSTSNYEEQSDDMKPYAPYGLSGVAGVSTVIKKRISLSTSCTRSFTPVLWDGDPYSGHHVIVHFALGYVFRGD